MTDKQWNALKMMTKRDHGQNFFPSTFSWRINELEGAVVRFHIEPGFFTGEIKSPPSP
jgi:hypothetical protein